jgi:hypothetical protein
MPPPPNPYAVANRHRWAHIVQHCRRDGGDPDVQRLGACAAALAADGPAADTVLDTVAVCRPLPRAGVSFRHNLGCSYRQHEELLRAIGGRPAECNVRGTAQPSFLEPAGSHPCINAGLEPEVDVEGWGAGSGCKR